MVCRFFRFEVVGTDETKVNVIKDWIETKIDNTDKVNINGGGISVYEDLAETGIFTLVCDLYLKESVAMNKYKDFVTEKWSTLNKTGLTSAKVIQYDNCSHDEEVPEPCSPDVRFEWVSE